MAYLYGLSTFTMYLSVGLGFILLFIGLYIYSTPSRELTLIRQGNTSASIALAGALLGFVFPLTSALNSAVSVLDLVIWASIAFIVQIIAYGLVRLLLPQFPERIERNELSSAVLAAAIHISIGSINAAAMSY